MTPRALACACVLLFCTMATAQPKQGTSGDCSPIIQATGRDVTINCALYSKELGAIAAQLEDIRKKVGPQQAGMLTDTINNLLNPVIKGNQDIMRKMGAVATKADLTALSNMILDGFRKSQNDPAVFVRDAQEWKSRYEARSYLALAQAQITSDPIEALLLAQKAHRLEASAESTSTKEKAIRELYDRLNRQRSYNAYARPAGWLLPTGTYFDGKDFSVSNRDRTLTVGAPETEKGRGALDVFLTDAQAGRIVKLAPSCPGIWGPERVSAVRFSKSQRRILVARQSFLSVYTTTGELVADVCRWFTKDQWAYLELLENDSVLLASAGQGQLMLFAVDTAAAERIKPLTGEFDNRVAGGPVALLETNPTEKLLLSTHRLGYAYLWRFDARPSVAGKFLTLAHRFELPQAQAAAEGGALKLSRSDNEFITSATMAASGPDTHFLTTFKAGPAIQWKLERDTVVVVRSLAHGTSSVVHASFSSDASKMLTLAQDASLKVWDTLSGAVLDVEDASTVLGSPR